VKRVFNSLEIDILPKGNLPVPDGGLQTLDFALVSIHSSFRQPKVDMTKRVLEGLSHPKVKVFAHPTARKLNEREGIDLDWEKIFDFCLKNNKWVEINADPMRLDLPDNLVHEAVKRGVKMTMGTDAHHFSHMDNMRYAVSVARRGWAEKKDIINTLSLAEFEKVIE
jgi:DNA polymerase (family 10)